MKILKRIRLAAYVFVMGLLLILVIKPVETKAAANSSYDKIISYVQNKGQQTKEGSGIWAIKLDENTNLSYDSVNQAITVSYHINIYEDSSAKAITVFVNSPYGEVKLSYCDDIWGCQHLSYSNITERLYVNSNGKKFRYLEEWDCWNQDTGFETLDNVNAQRRKEIETEWFKVMNTCSEIIKKKVGVTFKPFTDISGYSELTGAYYEPVATTVSVKLPFEISYSTLTALNVGDSITYKASYDFDGDKKKDKLTVKLTANSKEDYSYQYALLIKINDKKLVSDTISFGWEIEWKLSAFDLNPGDKYKELMSSYYEDVPTDYAVSHLTIYRYNGSRAKCLHDVLLQQDTVAKQKKNDNLQINASVWISGVGYSRISTSLLKGESKIVGPKNRIYTCLNSDKEYCFAQNINLYKTSDCKEKSGMIRIDDCGTIRKVKLEKDTLGVTHFYVCLTNGTKGWVNLAETSGWYLVSDFDEWAW